jgi:hypothetical protein
MVLTERQAAGCADIHVVGVAGAQAVVAELGVFDHDIAGGIHAGENAVFVVVNEAAAQREVSAFQAQGRTVLVRHLRAEHLDVFNDHVIALDHPDGLALRIGAGRIDARPPVHTANRQVAGGDGAHIGGIRHATGNFNHVVGTRRSNGGARCSIGFARTDRHRGGKSWHCQRSEQGCNAKLYRTVRESRCMHGK